MRIEELVYGTKGNETYLTIVFRKIGIEDISKLEARAAVYMFYDKQGKIMYVGETTTLKKRVHYHASRNRKTGNQQLSRDTIDYIEYAYIQADKYERAVMEGLLVGKYKPALNCDDKKQSESISKIPHEKLLDILFYIRNTDIKNGAIAKALGMYISQIDSVRDRGTIGQIDLPKDYKPKVIITEEMIKGFSKYTKVTKEVFFKVREELANGEKRQTDLAIETGLSHTTIKNIDRLNGQKYQKWEQERIEAVA